MSQRYALISVLCIWESAAKWWMHTLTWENAHICDYVRDDEDDDVDMKLDLSWKSFLCARGYESK